MQQTENAHKNYARQNQPGLEEEFSYLQRIINGILTRNEKEDLHDFLDDFFLSYLLENAASQEEREDLSDRFYFYSHLHAFVRAAERTNYPTLKICKPWKTISKYKVRRCS